MSENFNIWVDINEKIENLEVLKKEINDIDEIKEIEESKDHGVIISLLLVLVGPIIIEVIRRKAPIAIEKFKNLLKRIMKKAKKSSNKAELTIEYKDFVINIENEEEIEKSVEELIKYA